MRWLAESLESLRHEGRLGEENGEVLRRRYRKTWFSINHDVELVVAQDVQLSRTLEVVEQRKSLDQKSSDLDFDNYCHIW
jgi:hypothetical protein